MRCVEWYDKFEKDGNFCGLSASGVSQVKAYNEMRAKIATHIPDKAFVVDNFTENASRAIPKFAKDDETRTKAINWVITRLKNKEPVVYGDLQKTITTWQKPKETTVDNKDGNLGHVDENFTYVKSPTDEKPKELPVPAYVPQPHSIVVTADPPIQPLGKIIDLSSLPEISKDAPMSEVLKRDELLLAMATGGQNEAFHPASQDGIGNTFVKTNPLKVGPVKFERDAAEDLLVQWVRGYLTNKDREAIGRIMSNGEFGKSYNEIFTGLIWYAVEQMGGV